MDTGLLNKEEEDGLESLLMGEERSVEANGVEGCIHSEPSPEATAARLVKLKHISRDGDELVLTTSGRELARSLVRRHRLTEVLLDTVLGLDRSRSFDIGCQMEHGMLPEMAEAFCTLLGHPTACPHGWAIPPGPCCKAHRTTVESTVVPLTELAPGESGRVIFIKPRSHHRLHRLTSMGLMPGVVLELHQKSPAFCFRFEGTELAIDKDVAGDIHVARIES